MSSSTDLIMRLVQKKFHHQLNEVSVEEILEVMNEMSVDMGILQAKTEQIKSNQKFIQDLLIDRLKDGVGT